MILVWNLIFNQHNKKTPTFSSFAMNKHCSLARKYSFYNNLHNLSVNKSIGISSFLRGNITAWLFHGFLCFFFCNSLSVLPYSCGFGAAQPLLWRPHASWSTAVCSRWLGSIINSASLIFDVWSPDLPGISARIEKCFILSFSVWRSCGWLMFNLQRTAVWENAVLIF